MKTKRLFGFMLMLAVSAATFAQSKVYFTKEITPEALVKIYKALGRPVHGRVAVKISTGEDGGNNYLKPALIRNLVDTVHGTIVECNTAYNGSRNTTAAHWRPSTSTASIPSPPLTSWTSRVQSACRCRTRSTSNMTSSALISPTTTS